MIAEKIIENVVGFNKWVKSWGDWHRGIAGRPDCKKCEGAGVYPAPNGLDDFDLTRCNCLKKHAKVQIHQR